jgi:proton-dependent oligopeptide transporter, POT family
MPEIQPTDSLSDKSDRRFFGHPRGLATLFFTEMWERFSYYGMRAILILFMTAPLSAGGLGFDVATASVIYGLYTAGTYMAALPGGWIADRFLGLQRAVLIGGALIAAGNALLAVPTTTAFYSGLAVVVAGTGLLKPNVSAMVGQLYAQSDSRRDAGFSIFYMGINIGAFISPLICGYVAQRIYWRYGFVLAAIGMSAGLVQYVLGKRHLFGAGKAPVVEKRSLGHARDRRMMAIGALAVAAIVLMVVFLSAQGLVSAKAIADASGALLLGIVTVFFGWMFLAAKWTPVERKRLVVIAILFVASCIFWSVFEQAGSTLNLFASEKTDNEIAGFNMPASWYQSINALFIITLAPVFAWQWIKLGNREPSSPAKFVLGLLLVGSGFVVLAFGAGVAETGVKVSPIWLLVTYLLHTMGELCLSPVGLSAMTKLAPSRVAGLMMGVWFLSLSIGNYIGGRLAAFYEALPLNQLFGFVGLFAIVVGVLLALLVRPMVRLMGGVR